MKKSVLKSQLLFILMPVLLIISGCKKKTEEIKIYQDTEKNALIDSESENSSVPDTSDHAWYYFTKEGFFETDLPQNAPAQMELPWTEAIRISSAGNGTDSDETVCKAYAVVNRSGILCFDNDRITLSKDQNLFADRTAGNLVFMNDTPVFTVYKSAFFNDTISDNLYKNDGTQHLFLIQFDPYAKICYPILNCSNLTNEANSEVTDFFWDGYNCLCTVKTIEDSKISFSHLKWSPTISLLEISPGTAKDHLSITAATQNDIRSLREPLPYEKAPERIKSLTKSLADKKSFILEIKNAGGTSSYKYQNNLKTDKDKPLNASAILAKSWSAALFEDGTLYLEGALPGKHILREGKPIAIRLPKLPAGFVYSDFVISGTTLYAAWEETSFYKTVRSGFLQVNLEKNLYSKLR